MSSRILKFNLLFVIILLFSSTLEYKAQSREVIILNDGWQFTLAKEELEYINLTDTSWKNVRIPHTWNNKDIQSGKRVHYGTGWYKRELAINVEDTDKQYFLKFDGVGQYAALYINNRYVGEHLGSYSAFVFNISNFLKKDEPNTILVKVNNELTESYPKDNFLFGIYGGIYRGVSLITTNNIHIALTDYASSGVYVHQGNVSAENALLRIENLLMNESSEIKHISVKNKLVTKDLKIVSEIITDTVLYPGGVIPLVSHLIIKNPRLWNGKKDPYLYTLETTLLYDSEVYDEIEQSIGIRSFYVDPQRGFILNGEAYKLYGVCRHQEWQDKGNALLPEHHKKDMDLINEVGATSIRLAHYQQAEYMYSLADSIGFLIWAEIPFVNGYKLNADHNAKLQLTELIKQNFNHPSIFVWGMHNEVIKGRTIQRPVNLTKELHNIAKTLDPKRYTVAVSNIWWVYDHVAHENTDLQGFNQYSGWYGGRPKGLGKWIKNYHSKKPDVRIAISEYGAGANITHQTSDLSITPDPKGQFFPETYQTYYHEVTYSAIEEYPFIWSSYVWNMFDFALPEWNRGGIKGRNHKGLITYDRKTKKDAFYWYKANWSEEPVLYLTGRRNNILEADTTTIKTYCNFGVPELFVNGKILGKMDKGINSVQFVKRGIPLLKGENKIETKAVYKNKIYADEFLLNVDLQSIKK